MGIEYSQDLRAEALGLVVINALKSYGVDVTKVVAQCYDGANVMSGDFGGMQVVVSRECGRIIPYIHCFNHRLHLVIKEILRTIRDARSFFRSSTNDVQVLQEKPHRQNLRRKQIEKTNRDTLDRTLESHIRHMR